MNQYLQQLNNLAAQNEGGGDDSIPQKWEMRSKGGEYYFVDDKNQRFGGTYKSIEEANKAMSQAKKDGRFQQGVDRMSVRQPGQATAPGTPVEAQKTGWRDRGAAKSGPFYVDAKGTEYYMKGDKNKDGDYNVYIKEKGKAIKSNPWWASGKNEEDAMRSFFNDWIGPAPQKAVSALDFNEGETRPDVQLVTQRSTRGGIQDRERLDRYREFAKEVPQEPYYQKSIAKLENKIGIGGDRQPLSPSGQVSYDGPMTGGIGQGQQVDIPYTDPGTAFYHQGDQSNMGVFDPAQSVQQGAAQQSGGGIVSGPNATAGSAAVSPQGLGTENKGFPGERRSRGFGATWEAPGTTERFTQEDFYPNPQDPGQIGYSTGVEVYARPGRLPMGAISKAATILNNRQVELDQKRQAMMEELYKPIKTATPYQQNFNQIVNSEHDKFIKSVADAYTGGNIAKANRLIMSNPELRARWRQQNADLESLGARGQYVFDKAVNYLSNAATLKIASNPETRQLANDIIYGMGGYGTKDGEGGDFNTLISKINQFENLMGRDTYFKENVVPSVKDFVRSTTDKPTYDTNRGLWIMSESTKKEWDSQKDVIAREMTTTGFGSYAENYEFLDKMLPASVETKTTVRDIPRATGGDGGAGADATKAGIYYEAVSSTQKKPIEKGTTDEVQKFESVTSNVVKAARGVGANIPEKAFVDNLMFFETSGGRPVMPRVVTIGNQAIVPVSVFTDKKGGVYLVAKRSKYAGAGKQGQGGVAGLSELMNSMKAADGTVDIDKFNNLEDVVIPYQEAAGFIQQASGGMLTSEAVIRDQINQGRIAQGKQPVDWSAVLSGGRRTTAPASETPPEPGAVRIQGYDGWWKEENGKVVQVK